MRYSVKTFRAAGLEAKWIKTRSGAPIISVRQPGQKWYVVDARMFAAMKKDGIVPAFKNYTLLGDYFWVPA